MHEVKALIRESVELPLKNPEAFVRLGIRPPNGVLLYGPPGCSKTLLAKAVASESEMNFIAIKGPELLSKWVGDSEKAIQATFRRARLSKPCVIFFDEIDALAVQRSAEGGGVSHRVTSQLLQELDGIEPRSGVIVLCATNRPDLLDVALLRPGRIDRLVYVPPPDLDARMDILSIHLRTLPLLRQEEDIDLYLLGLNTEGFSGAEVASVCRNAALLAMERNDDFVSGDDLQRAIRAIVPQISPSVLDEFKGVLEVIPPTGLWMSQKHGLVHQQLQICGHKSVRARCNRIQLFRF
jgi:SpoVK/Ycf46/Vps4 family AAA+-type ATPase